MDLRLYLIRILIRFHIWTMQQAAAFHQKPIQSAVTFHGQPRSQALSPFPPLSLRRETLVGFMASHGGKLTRQCSYFFLIGC